MGISLENVNEANIIYELYLLKNLEFHIIPRSEIWVCFNDTKLFPAPFPHAPHQLFRELVWLVLSCLHPHYSYFSRDQGGTHSAKIYYSSLWRFSDCCCVLHASLSLRKSPSLWLRHWLWYFLSVVASPLPGPNTPYC